MSYGSLDGSTWTATYDNAFAHGVFVSLNGGSRLGVVLTADLLAYIGSNGVTELVFSNSVDASGWSEIALPPAWPSSLDSIVFVQGFVSFNAAFFNSDSGASIGSIADGFGTTDVQLLRASPGSSTLDYASSTDGGGTYGSPVTFSGGLGFLTNIVPTCFLGSTLVDTRSCAGGPVTAVRADALAPGMLAAQPAGGVARIVAIKAGAFSAGEPHAQLVRLPRGTRVGATEVASDLVVTARHGVFLGLPHSAATLVVAGGIDGAEPVEGADDAVMLYNVELESVRAPLGVHGIYVESWRPAAPAARRI